MNLQSLFEEPILEQTYLDPGYSGHASDVWRVRTAAEEVVVRASRVGSDQTGGTLFEFWWGSHHLFGIDPRRVFDLEPLNALLNQVSPIPAPRVLRKGRIDGRAFVVVERMPGEALKGFRDKPAALLEGFGAALARIHSLRFRECGNPSGSFRFPLAEFPARLVETMRLLVEKEYRGQRRIRAEMEPMCHAAALLPPPEAGALVLRTSAPASSSPTAIGSRQWWTPRRMSSALASWISSAWSIASTNGAPPRSWPVTARSCLRPLSQPSGPPTGISTGSSA